MAKFKEGTIIRSKTSGTNHHMVVAILPPDKERYSEHYCILNLYTGQIKETNSEITDAINEEVN